MDQTQEMLELLRRIEKSNRRKVVTNVLVCIFMLAAALSCIAICLTLGDLIPRVDQVISQMQNVLNNLEETSDALARLDLETMVTNVDSLAVYAQQSLQQTMEKLNTIDFETLNKAIGDLAKVIEPLAKLVDKFR